MTRKASEEARCKGVQQILNADAVRRVWTTRLLSDLRQKGSYRVPIRLRMPESSVWAAEVPAETWCYVPTVTFTIEKSSLSGFAVEVIFGVLDGIPDSKTLIRVIQ